jgi:hypothetical protein
MALFLRFCIEILWPRDTARRSFAMALRESKKTKPLDLLRLFGFVYVIWPPRDASINDDGAPSGAVSIV